MTKVLFIVNPHSGKRKALHLEEIVSEVLPSASFEPEVRYTGYPGHAEIMARESAADVVVAVGGDGTVNEVARGLLGSSKILGIVPVGSGNGLALHLGISRNPVEAVRTIGKMNVGTMDCGTINGHSFFCSCGVGMDAVVSGEFEKSGKRGLVTYVRKALEVFRTYRPSDYLLTVDEDKPKTLKAMLITIGNANQWGNNAFICPEAREDDGLLDITVIRPFPVWYAPVIISRLMSGRLYKCRYVDLYRGRHICLKRERVEAAHYDGECCMLENQIVVNVMPGCIRMVRPGK